MPTLTGTLRRPRDTDPSEGNVTIQLVGAGGKPVASAFLPGSDETLVETSRVPLDENGVYEIDLPANADILPAGTRWARSHRSGTIFVELADAPAVQREEDILSDPPAAIASPAVDVLSGRVNDLEDDTVRLSGAQTVAGVKTFADDIEWSLPAPSSVVDRGVIRQVHSIQVPWEYTLTDVPTDEAIGCAVRVDMDVVLGPQSDGFGPTFAPGHFGPNGAFTLAGVVRVAQNMSLIRLAPLGFLDVSAVGNVGGANRTITPSWGYVAARQLFAQNGVVTLQVNDTNNGGAGFVDTPVYVTTDGGTISGQANQCGITSLLSRPAVFGNVDLPFRIGVDIAPLIHDHFGQPEVGQPYPWAGRPIGDADALDVNIDEEIGVRVQELTSGNVKIGVDVANQGANGIGVRNASTEVCVPSVFGIAAAGVTIEARSKAVVVGSGAITMTSTPTIEDGVEVGQILILVKAGPGALTLQDQSNLPGSNLRLAGGNNVSLQQDDSLTLLWGGDTWRQLAHGSVN